MTEEERKALRALGNVAGLVVAITIIALIWMGT